jgi:hypothetical protein
MWGKIGKYDGCSVIDILFLAKNFPTERAVCEDELS